MIISKAYALEYVQEKTEIEKPGSSYGLEAGREPYSSDIGNRKHSTVIAELDCAVLLATVIVKMFGRSIYTFFVLTARHQQILYKVLFVLINSSTGLLSRMFEL